MTSPAESRSLTSPGVDDAANVLDRCRARILEREGIPMFVALHDARPGARPPLPPQGLSRTEADRLAVLFDHYRHGLSRSAPTRDPSDDPTGASALIDILVVLSDQHLRAPDEEGT